jgi:hypothetical protein
VATLETQKNRLIQGDGPALLVVDEYQMLGDPDRGLNYELAIALAPAQTQLLLLSGSVSNPHDVVKWFARLGRHAVLIRHEERPVPLEEVQANNLNYHVPTEIKGFGLALLPRPSRKISDRFSSSLRAGRLPRRSRLSWRAIFPIPTRSRSARTKSSSWASNWRRCFAAGWLIITAGSATLRAQGHRTLGESRSASRRGRDHGSGRGH